MKTDSTFPLDEVVEQLKSIGVNTMMEAIMKHNHKIDVLVELAKEHRQLQLHVNDLETRIAELERVIKTVQAENRI